MTHAGNEFTVRSIKAACIATLADIKQQRSQHREKMIAETMEPFRWFWVGPIIQYSRADAIEVLEYSYGYPWTSDYYDGWKLKEEQVCSTFLSMCDKTDHNFLWLTTEEYDAIGMAQHG